MADCSVAVATSSALAAFFSRECAQAYEPQPFRESQFVLSSAIHAIKYVRKQFTTASGYPLIYFVDLTGADCFVCPPFKKRQWMEKDRRESLTSTRRSPCISIGKSSWPVVSSLTS